MLVVCLCRLGVEGWIWQKKLAKEKAKTEEILHHKREREKGRDGMAPYHHKGEESKRPLDGRSGERRIGDGIICAAPVGQWIPRPLSSSLACGWLIVTCRVRPLKRN